MKLIYLTQNYKTTVDDEDYEWLDKYKWSVYILKGGHKYVLRRQQHTTILMHRNIMEHHNIIIDGYRCRHKDNDGLNNEKSNLLMTNSTIIGATQKMNSQNKSGYRGVWGIKNGNWRTSIVVNEQTIHLGTYSNKEDAALTYNKASHEYFGEYGYQNIIERKQS